MMLSDCASCPANLPLARLLLSSSLLLRSPLAQGSAALLAMARVLLPYTLRQAALEHWPGGGFGGAGPEAEGESASAPRRSPRSLACAAALALVSSCSRLAFGEGAEAARAVEAWGEGLGTLHAAACGSHPSLQHVASAVLACLVSLSPLEMAAQQMTLLVGTVLDLAAAEAAMQIGALVTGARGSTGLFSMCPVANARSPACRAALLLSVLASSGRFEDNSSAPLLQELGLSAPRSAVDVRRATSDIGRSFGSALLLYGLPVAPPEASADRPCGIALSPRDVAAWLHGLTGRSDELQADLVRLVPAATDAVAATDDWTALAPLLASAHLGCVLMAVDAVMRAGQQAIRQRPDVPLRPAMEAAVASAAEALLMHRFPTATGGKRAAEPPPHLRCALRVVARAGMWLPARTLSELAAPLTAALQHPDCAPYGAAAAAHCGAVQPLPLVCGFSQLS